MMNRVRAVNNQQQETTTMQIQKQQQQQQQQNHQQQVLSSEHLDYVHDVSFDVYGRRMATCSGDRFVRIWDLTDGGNWVLIAEYQAHRSAVQKVVWAHPEFGTLIATCSTDHEAKIWEERESSMYVGPAEGAPSSTTTTATTTLSTTTATSNSNLQRWVNKANLVDARRAVSCIEFAPRHLGLKIATGSADGMVRIYEAVDVMNLSQWPIQNTISAFSNDSQDDNSNGGISALGVTCLSWCNGRFEPPTLVVGGTHLVIYRYSSTTRQWQSIMSLANTAGPSNTTSIENSRSAIATRGILDVSWAPNVGRRYHLIASAGVDSKLRVYKLTRGGTTAITTGEAQRNNTSNIKNDGGSAQSSQIQLVSEQTLENKEGTSAWRCQWNVTGTVLAVSGGTGVVELWKSDFNGVWKSVSEIAEKG